MNQGVSTSGAFLTGLVKENVCLRFFEHLALRIGKRESLENPPTTKSTLLALLLVIAVCASVASAQEMEPRAYSRAPVGSQFIVFSYTYQTGDVLTDAALPLEDISTKLSAGSFAYGRTFGIAGRQANASVLASYVKGRAKGIVFEDRQEVTRSGVTDTRLRFSMNLIGGPALSRKDFAMYKSKALLGASVTVIMPTGQYDPRRLINIGSNRWSFKPEMGLSKPFGRWTVEMIGGVWFFSANDNFFGGVRREQKPLLSFQSHVIYTVRSRMWVAVNASYYTGGRSVVNGVINANKQANSRIGGTFSLPLNQRQSIKIAFGKGLTTRFGGDVTTVVTAWQYAW